MKFFAQFLPHAFGGWVGLRNGRMGGWADGWFAKVDNVFLRLGGFAKVDNRSMKLMK